MVTHRTQRDVLGSILGLLVFLGGIGLMLLVFKLAYEMFTVPPDQALGIAKGKAIDIAQAGNSLTSIGVRIILLIVMGIVGSMVANRGISLYGFCRGIKTATKQPVETPS